MIPLQVCNCLYISCVRVCLCMCVRCAYVYACVRMHLFVHVCVYVSICMCGSICPHILDQSVAKSKILLILASTLLYACVVQCNLHDNYRADCNSLTHLIFSDHFG